MFRTTRLLLVTCLTTGLITIPWNDALAGERGTEESQSQAPDAPILGEAQATPEPMTGGAPEPSIVFARLPSVSDAAGHRGKIWRTALLTVPGQSPRVLRQAVASTNQHNFILGATAAALVIGGVGLIAYSTTASCKLGQTTSSSCDRAKVLGALGISGGSVMFALWALSK